MYRSMSVVFSGVTCLIISLTVHLVSGAKVSDTIRKGIIDIEPYKNNTELLMVGNVAALTGECLEKFTNYKLHCRFPPGFIHRVIIITGLNKLYDCMFMP